MEHFLKEILPLISTTMILAFLTISIGFRKKAAEKAWISGSCSILALGIAACNAVENGPFILKVVLVGLWLLTSDLERKTYLAVKRNKKAETAQTLPNDDSTTT
jgi:hypothetical protein